MTEKKETYEFKTEVQQLLNLIINSLYSNKDIFLRELISNASDAIDRLKFKAQTNPDLIKDNAEFKLKITPDAINRTIEVSDNGIGMTHDEVLENIGTIAKSGTADFIEAFLATSQDNVVAPELIGQFGVGFYSSFIVAEKVTLITRSAEAKSDMAVKWESYGDGTYTIEPTQKDTRGTTIKLTLKKFDKEETDFTDQFVIRNIVKKHSDFVRYPIVMDVEKDEPIPEAEQIKDKDGKTIGATTKKVVKEETLNSMKAIWTRDRSEISEEEYKEFYSHISHDWNPPLEHLHLKFEGTTEYSALLYIPSKAPFDLFQPDAKHGIHLYCKRVFIMDDCKELIPEYLGFIKGVVDAPDLNLNVSREILQQDRLILNIRKNLIKKILEMIKGLDEEKFNTLWDEFGSMLKIGVHTDADNKTKIAELLRYKTTTSQDKWVSLSDYVSRMKPDQKDIYYITGENLALLANSPLLENLKEKGYEVLLMTDPVDEWVVQSLSEYDGKKLISAEKGDLEIDTVDESKKKDYNALFSFIKGKLADHVKEVRPSNRLKDSLACLSGDSYDLSAYMEKILKSSGQELPENKRVLEVNMNHPVIDKIKSLYEADQKNPDLEKYSKLLYDMAVIGEGGKVDDPSKLSRTVGELMSAALK